MNNHQHKQGCSCHDHRHTADHGNCTSGAGHDHGHDGCCCGHSHSHPHSHSEGHSAWRLFVSEALSAVLMAAALLIEWNSGAMRLAAYIVAVLPVAVPILGSTLKEWLHGDVFNEFTLMVMASIGAFCIGEYPEGVAVLLFYSIGEKLEDVVSGDVKGQIKRLLGKMPKRAVVVENGMRREVRPQDVTPGMTIAVRPGEAAPLDGILAVETSCDFNTAAITGESMPRTFVSGDTVSSGMIPVDREVLLTVTNAWDDSSMTRIMRMIEDAASHRAPSETILRRITRWYTPVVFAAALLLFVIPWIVGLLDSGFTFEWASWLRRSLVFLVCSCPCALIVSIPLTYFSSIGIASKNGILFKGHDSLDALRRADTVFFDKTGTVTTGKFHVDSVLSLGELDRKDILALVASVERESTHPLAVAIVEEAANKGYGLPEVEEVRTCNHGMTALSGGNAVLIGSVKLMKESGIVFPVSDSVSDSATTVCVAIDGAPAGIISLADTVKPGSAEAVALLHADGVDEVGILSGDTEKAVRYAASSVGADISESELLPADKQRIIAGYRRKGHVVAFAGDGVNDAPALAAADIGIAMGHIGTDLAIESAQVVIASDDLRKIHEGINISRRVKRVIIENVSFAFGVKIIVMALGAFGIASLWAAVFADTGVTVMTVLWTLFRLKIWQLKKNAKASNDALPTRA